MKMVRYGMLGFGGWGREHARIINETENATLVAVAARTAKSRKAAKADYSVKVYSDYKELITNEDVDIIDIVLPDHLHYEAAVTALQAGKNIFVEKPMALTVEECDHILELVEERKRAGGREPILAVGFELRTSTLWKPVKDLIQQGKIGIPQALNIEGFRQRPPAGAEKWRLKKNRVSDWLLDAPIHCFDLIRWYFEGIGEPQTLYAAANSMHEGIIVDNFSATIRFPNGSYATLFYTMGGYKYYYIVKVIGDEGAIWAHWGEGEAPNMSSPEFFLQYGAGGNKHEILIEELPGEVFDLEHEIKQVTRAIREGEPAPATGQDGREAVRLCLAAARSVESGEAVTL